MVFLEQIGKILSSLIFATNGFQNCTQLESELLQKKTKKLQAINGNCKKCHPQYVVSIIYVLLIWIITH